MGRLETKKGALTMTEPVKHPRKKSNPLARLWASAKRKARAFVENKQKAIAAGVSQLVTTAISWVGLHTVIDVPPADAALVAATIGAAVSSRVVYLIDNKLLR
jgi:hypothetical protein